MNSGDPEKQKSLLCWKMTQNQVCKGEVGDMEASNRKTLTWGSRQKELLSLGSYLTHAPQLSQSLENCSETFPLTWLIYFISSLQDGLESKRSRQANDSWTRQIQKRNSIIGESRIGLVPKLMPMKSKLSDSWLSPSSPKQWSECKGTKSSKPLPPRIWTFGLI